MKMFVSRRKRASITSPSAFAAHPFSCGEPACLPVSSQLFRKLVPCWQAFLLARFPHLDDRSPPLCSSGDIVSASGPPDCSLIEILWLWPSDGPPIVYTSSIHTWAGCGKLRQVGILKKKYRPRKKKTISGDQPASRGGSWPTLPMAASSSAPSQ